MPSTACTTPREVSNCTCKSSTASSGVGTFAAVAESGDTTALFVRLCSSNVSFRARRCRFFYCWLVTAYTQSEQAEPPWSELPRRYFGRGRRRPRYIAPDGLALQVSLHCSMALGLCA